jgi:CheY-like chemotaxis protein
MLQLLTVSISKRAILKSELAADLPRVSGNPAQIRQLIMNLIINASDALGGSNGEIRVTTQMLRLDRNTPDRAARNVPDGDYVQLEVADTGIGMSEEAATRIFDPFFTTKPTGRGLGLAVVQGVVHAHRGAIRVMSKPGAGATFQILLPCVQHPERETRAAAARRPVDECLSGAGKILIIEDEDTLRVAVARMLRKRGFSVIEAKDGNSGVDLFIANALEIDIVLLDISLPGKSGPEVLRELQQIRTDVKVIITSAYGKEKVTTSLDSSQRWGYIQKPYRIDELISLLGNV